MNVIPTDWKLIEWFTPIEVTCRCGCGRADMDHNFMLLLDRIRNDLGYGVSLSSGFRCPEYNDEVSSTGLVGPHTTGLAVDALVSGKQAHEFLKLAMLYGAMGIGVSQKGLHKKRFIHIDVIAEGGTRPWAWSY